MPRNAADIYSFNLARGYITEASKLQFPENAATDLDNVVLDLDGKVRRRPGIDYEGSSTIPFTYAASNGQSRITSHVWSSNGGYYDEDIYVLGLGAKLYFFDKSVEPLSAGYLGTLTVSGARNRDQLQMADGNGKLYVVSRKTDPHVVEIDQTTGALSIYSVTLKVRDTEGVNGGYDERASTFTDAIRYNLLNAGWPDGTVDYSGRVPGVNPKKYAWDLFKGQAGVYPGTADNWNDYRNGSNMNQNLIDTDFNVGGSPKGRNILDAFDQDRSSFAGFSTGATDDEGVSTTKTTDERPRAVGFFQGHVAYAGCTGNDYQSSILISQTVLNKKGEGFCYQVNDPTAPDNNTPLATDGGVIKIEGLSNVKAMRVLSDSLLIFGENGLWSISPGSEGLFKMNDFRIRKLYSAGCVNANSIAESGDSILYWSPEGVILVSLDDTLADLKAQNISDQTVKDFYDEIGAIAQTLAQAVTDTVEKKVYWMYPSTATNDAEWPAKLDRALCLDLRTGAFYKYSLGLTGTSPFVIGGIAKPGRSVSTVTEDVVVSPDTVVVGADTVVVDTEAATSAVTASLLKLVTFIPNSGDWDVRFSDFTNANLYDWETWDGTGIDYSSYVETGYVTGGASMYDKSIEMVEFYFERTESSFIDNGSGGVTFDLPSGCKMRAKWDWTTSADFNRWSQEQQVYRFLRPYVIGAIGDPFNYDQEVINTRVRVRGSGKSFLLRLESESGKDFRLIGWGARVSSGGRP